MNAQNLRGWLLQLPKPALLRCTVDGEVEELKPGKSWQKLAETIAALQPELVQALDAEGNILRALRPDTADARRSDAAEIPTGLAADPQALMLTHFANLLHRAYEHSTEIAFGKIVELVDKMNDRSEGIEQRLERAEARARRLQEDNIEDAYARAEELAAQAAETGGNDELKNHLLGAFLSGKMNGPPKPNGASNGASNGKAATQ
jgi:hypothetical protein